MLWIETDAQIFEKHGSDKFIWMILFLGIISCAAVAAGCCRKKHKNQKFQWRVQFKKLNHGRRQLQVLLISAASVYNIMDTLRRHLVFYLIKNMKPYLKLSLHKKNVLWVLQS